MPTENPSDLEIALPANPWLYGPPLFLAANAALYGTWPGWLIVSIVLGGLAAWALMRAQCVRVRFDTKEAIFVNSPLNPLRQHRTVSLAAYTRVYATAFIRNGGWSIHLAGPRGEHVRLAAIPDFPSFSLRNDRIRALCTEIARGLGISNDGLAGMQASARNRPAPE